MNIEEFVDITDRVSVYEKGKTFECECGQGFGVKHKERIVKCPTCGEVLVDKESESREYKRPEGQMTLESF